MSIHEQRHELLREVGEFIATRAAAVSGKTEAYLTGLQSAVRDLEAELREVRIELDIVTRQRNEVGQELETQRESARLLGEQLARCRRREVERRPAAPEEDPR